MTTSRLRAEALGKSYRSRQVVKDPGGMNIAADYTQS
jgi:hypothetical protein